MILRTVEFVRSCPHFSVLLLPPTNDQMIASYDDRARGQQDHPAGEETNEGYSAMIIFSRGSAAAVSLSFSK